MDAFKLNIYMIHKLTCVYIKFWPTSEFVINFLSAIGWTSAFLLAVHRLCGVIEGRLSHFLPRWLRTGWQSAISQGKIPWNTPPWLGIEPGPRGGQTVSYPTELSWLTVINSQTLALKTISSWAESTSSCTINLNSCLPAHHFHGKTESNDYILTIDQNLFNFAFSHVCLPQTGTSV